MTAVLTIDAFSNAKWAVRLEKEGPDADDAVRFFSSGGEVVVRKQVVAQHPDKPFLLAREFEAFTEALDVRNAAERILHSINGILLLDEPAREPLTVSAVYPRNADGVFSGGIVFGRADILLRGMKLFAHTGPPTKPVQVDWLETALADDDVSEVLSYLRGFPDWFDLFKASEAVRLDIKRKKAKAPWDDADLLHKFNGDAQLHRHSKAYCDSKGLRSSSPMQLREARDLMRRIVSSWLRWRHSLSTNP